MFCTPAGLSNMIGYLLMVSVLLSVAEAKKCVEDHDPAKVLNLYGGLSNDQEQLASVGVAEARVDWGNLLSPAPAAIGLLSSLILVTAEHDVSLTDTEPTNGWKRVNRPSSLRASLLQVAHEGYNAMQDANHNMATIQLDTENAMTYFDNIKELLASEDVEERRELLPIQIKSLADIAPRCKILAIKTSAVFHNVTLLIQELLEGCTSAKSYKEIEKIKTANDMAIKQALNETLMKQKELIENQINEAKTMMDTARTKLNKAIDAKPGLAEMLGAAAIDMVMSIKPAEMIQAMMGVATMMKAPGMGALNGLMGSKTKNQNTGVSSYNSDPAAVTDQDVSDMMALAGIFKEKISPLVRQPLRIVKSLISGSNDSKPGEINELLETFTTVLPYVDDYGTASQEKHASVGGMATTMADMIREGKTTVERIRDATTSASFDNTKLTSLEPEAQHWQTRVIQFEATFNKIAATPKNQPITGETVDKIEKDPSTAAKLNEAYQTQIAASEKLYEHETEVYKFQLLRLDKKNEEANKLFVALKALKLTEADLVKAIEILREAILKLADLEHQWLQLEQFFRQIEQVISVSWYEKTMLFVKTAEAKGQSAKNKITFGTGVVYRTAFEAVRLNFRVNKMAKTYVEVSEKHFLPPLQKLPKLLQCETKQSIEKARQDIVNVLADAQVGIRKIVERDAKDVQESIKVYLTRIENSYQALCPSEETIKYIDQVQNATVTIETSIRSKLTFTV